MSMAAEPQMNETQRLPANHSAVFLSDANEARRLPRAPGRVRPPAFHANYESRALFYDAFWHADGKTILLVGPPPLNLWPLYNRARYRALPGRTVLGARYYPSLSTMITRLSGAPLDTREVVVEVGGERFCVPVQPSSAGELEGHRVLFTTSKDNDLGWVREWARYHAKVQGATAIVFFDNGSRRYGREEIDAHLSAVLGIERVAVVSWPYAYGATDPKVIRDPYYALFLQVSAMTVALRRYAARAAGLLNCDVDELAATPKGTNIFELAGGARHGLVVMAGQQVEAVPTAGGKAPPFTHKDFQMRLRDKASRTSRSRKWALDPCRDWVRNLAVHPYMHWIEGRPAYGKTWIRGCFYWHFRGISTNWKDQRTHNGDLRSDMLETDELLAQTMADRDR